MIIFRIIYESILQALHQLNSNRLRSFLSLLGISIGILCIIGVKSAVDSLEDNIRGSFEKLGNDVLYVKKFSWSEPPHQSWWKYMRRPNPSHEDYKIIKKKVKSASSSAYYAMIGRKTIKYRSNSVDNAVLFGTTSEFQDIFALECESGRFLSPSEFHYGAPKLVLGYKVAQELFGNVDPIGKTIKLMGKKMEVVGVIKKSGKDLINPLDFDECILVSFQQARTMANLKSRYIFDATVLVKANEGVSLDQLKDEVTGIMRSHRRLKPVQDDNFALNELSMLSMLMDGFFSVLNIAGLFIGIFAILVGMFSVANIMFVSVKERTNIIGIKKALGARSYVILLEFLIESVILCIIGGLMGLGLVLGIIKLITMVLDFQMWLSFENIFWGISISVIIGMLSGVIPAIQAARMDPVVAIRSK